MQLTVEKADAHLCATAAGIAEIITRKHYFSKDDGEILYWYHAGVYKKGADREIVRACKKILQDLNKTEKWSSHKAKEVVAYISADSPLLSTTSGMEYLNVRNGLIDLRTLKLVPHMHEYRTAVQLPIDFNPDAKCEAWEKVNREVFPADAQEFIREFAAWLMVPDVAFQKAVVFLGSGANGKSTILNGIKAFLGTDNVSSVSLQDLGGNRFASTQLIGKLANICSDLPNAKLLDTGVFKAITGGDAIRGEYKHGKAFDFKPTARLVFSANEMPRSADVSDGYYRRFLVVPFQARFENDPEVGRRLDAALSNPKEMSGLLNMALAVLPEVRKRGITISQSMQDAAEEHRRSTDPVAEWLDADVVEAEGQFVSNRELMDAYRANTRSSISPKALGQGIKRCCPTAKPVQRTIDGQRPRGYLGIQLQSVLEEAGDAHAARDARCVSSLF